MRACGAGMLRGSRHGNRELSDARPELNIFSGRFEDQDGEAGWNSMLELSERAERTGAAENAKDEKESAPAKNRNIY